MEKMPLRFLVEATESAKQELLNKVAGTCTVSCTANYTVFLHNSKCLVSKGNLHDKVDAPFCIEFDLRYNHGAVVVIGQRIYQ